MSFFDDNWIIFFAGVVAAVYASYASRGQLQQKRKMSHTLLILSLMLIALGSGVFIFNS